MTTWKTKDGHFALTDKRTRIGKTIAYYFDWYQDNRSSFWSAVLLGLLAGTVVSVSFWRAKHDPNPFSDRESPVKTTIELAVVSTATPTPTEDYYKADKLRYIRYAAPQAGLSDKDASMLIRIARAEAYCWIEPEAVNYLYDGPNGRYSAAGSFMITTSTWKGNNCTGSKFNFHDATDCAIKIYKRRGTQPWDESKHLPNGNGWDDPHQCEKYFSGLKSL